MRKYLQIIPILALAAAVPAPAHAIEFLDRIFDISDITFEQQRSTPEGSNPFRVGLMLPTSGPLREPAERIVRGWKIALSLSDGYVADRPVHIITGDTSDGTAEAIRNAETMSGVAPIDVFAGVLGARIAKALIGYTGEIDKPLVLAGAVGERVMSGTCHAHVARTSFNIGPYQTTSGRFIAGKFRTLVTLGPDTPGGYRIIKRFTKAYRQGGGRIVEQIWAPATRKYDWSALLARATLGGPQAVYTFFEGRNAERIVTQYSRTGVKLNTRLTGPEWLFGPRVMNRRGKHADGLRFLTGFFPDLDSPGNRIFVDAYREAYFEEPDAYAYLGYENALAVLLTAADLHGTQADAAGFITAMKNVAYTVFMPRGDFGLNETNSAFLTRLFWVGIEHDDAGTRLKRLGSIPIDPDDSTCKKQTAAYRHSADN
jgi:branched-chain amino acid transport system substrate-binding protein